MKVLTVDWDYFFPDLVGYDWSHNEDNPIYRELIWSMRVSNYNMLNGKHIMEEVKPDENLLKDFWKRTISNIPEHIIIVESHSQAFAWLKKFPGQHNIVNYDQHHDAGYMINHDVIDCGNWAEMLHKIGKIEHYTVIYPAWRKDAPESKPKFKISSNYFDHNDRFVCDYDLLFICRSPEWTPTWHDQKWLNFIRPWLNKKTHVLPEVIKSRSPNMEEALNFKKDMEERKRELLWKKH